MFTRTKCSGAILVAIVSSVCNAQQVGTVEGYRAEARANNAASITASVQAAEDRNARIDAAVNNMSSFIKWVKESREARVHALYASREQIREQKGDAKTKHKLINEQNAEILKLT